MFISRITGRIFIVTFAMSLIPMLRAQVIDLFPPVGENINWIYQRSNNNLQGLQEFYHAGEDQAIDGNTYSVIRSNNRYVTTLGMGNTSISESYGDLYCYLRQDLTGVVYVRSTPSDPELILFDPSIEIGDTVPSTWRCVQSAYYTNVVTVSAIDTILDNFGTPHRVHHFNAPGYPVPTYFTNGIGCGNEFLSLFASSSGAPLSTFRCIRVDEETLLGSNCVSLTVGYSDHSGTHTRCIAALSNLVTDVLIITGDLPTDAQYFMLSPLGIVLSRGALREKRIDVADLPASTYTLVVTDRSGVSIGTLRFAKV